MHKFTVHSYLFVGVCSHVEYQYGLIFYTLRQSYPDNLLYGILVYV